MKNIKKLFRMIESEVLPSTMFNMKMILPEAKKELSAIEIERGSSPVHNQFCQPGEAGSKGGPQNAGDDIRVLQLKLRDADIVMKVIDDLIKGGALDARSIIGDARLNYGDPYDYKYLQG